MALVWSWGWEINAPTQSYLDAGWISSNSAFVDTSYLDSAQPLNGTGGGERCLKIMQYSTTFQTPYIPGQPSLFEIYSGGWISFYVKFTGKFWNDHDGDFFKFGGCYLTTDKNGSGKTTTAQLNIKDVNGTITQLDPIALLTQDVWHRISIKIDVGAITEIYYNGQLCSSGMPGLLIWDPSTGGDTISAIEFSSPSSPASDETYYDHIFVYNDASDDGDRELYIHGLKAAPGASTLNIGWTDKDGNDATGEDLYEVGDNNYLKTTTSSNDLVVLYIPVETFDEVIAINQISYNLGSGNLNRLTSYLTINNGAQGIQAPTYTSLQSTGKFTNILLTSTEIDTIMENPGFTQNAVHQTPVAINGAFLIDDDPN